MALTVSKYLQATDNPIYYSEGFRNYFEDCLSWLKNNGHYNVIDVDPGIAYQYEACFYSLCQYYGIPHQLHWPTLRMMDMVSPEESSADIKQLIVPLANEMSQLVQQYQAANLV